jgi:DNA-binding NtrC family response regulator
MIWVALLVDDDNRFRSTLARFLKREGYLVNDAGNGADVLRLIEKRSFDFVVSDYDLKSEINGLDVIAKFNELQPGKGKIVVSGHCELKADVMS